MKDKINVIIFQKTGDLSLSLIFKLQPHKEISLKFSFFNLAEDWKTFNLVCRHFREKKFLLKKHFQLQPLNSQMFSQFLPMSAFICNQSCFSWKRGCLISFDKQ